MSMLDPPCGASSLLMIPYPTASASCLHPTASLSALPRPCRCSTCLVMSCRSRCSTSQCPILGLLHYPLGSLSFPGCLCPRGYSSLCSHLMLKSGRWSPWAALFSICVQSSISRHLVWDVLISSGFFLPSSLRLTHSIPRNPALIRHGYLKAMVP